VTMMHDPFGIEFPVFVSIRAVPLSRIVMEFISEANRDPVAIVSPELLDEAVIQLALPFAHQEAHNLFPSVDELCPVPPHTVRCIGERDLLGIARVPAVFCLTNLKNGSLFRKRRNQVCRRSTHCLSFSVRVSRIALSVYALNLQRLSSDAMKRSTPSQTRKTQSETEGSLPTIGEWKVVIVGPQPVQV